MKNLKNLLLGPGAPSIEPPPETPSQPPYPNPAVPTPIEPVSPSESPSIIPGDDIPGKWEPKMKGRI